MVSCSNGLKLLSDRQFCCNNLSFLPSSKVRGSSTLMETHFFSLLSHRAVSLPRLIAGRTWTQLLRDLSRFVDKLSQVSSFLWHYLSNTLMNPETFYNPFVVSQHLPHKALQPRVFQTSFHLFTSTTHPGSAPDKFWKQPFPAVEEITPKVQYANI